MKTTRSGKMYRTTQEEIERTQIQQQLPISESESELLECENCNNYLMKISSLDDKVIDLEHRNANLSVGINNLNSEFVAFRNNTYFQFQSTIEMYKRLYEDENKRLNSDNNKLIFLLVLLVVVFICILVGLVMIQQKKM
jgi:hypothetical protein